MGAVKLQPPKSIKDCAHTEHPEGKLNRLSEYHYSQNGADFVTICTQDRHKILLSVVGDGSSFPGEAKCLPDDNTHI